jgi:hypothetical protein
MHMHTHIHTAVLVTALLQTQSGDGVGGGAERRLSKRKSESVRANTSTRDHRITLNQTFSSCKLLAMHYPFIRFDCP